MRSVFVVLVLGLCASIFGQYDVNYTGYGDESLIAEVGSFNADSSAYTKAFLLSSYEDLRIDLMADDTTVAGFAGDSVHVRWGVQTGHLVKNRSGSVDTLWNAQHLIVDTLNSVSGTWGPQYTSLALDGTYDDVAGATDTVSVSGYMVQSRNTAIAWDALFRCWVEGLGDNLTGELLVLKFNVVRRLYTNVK